MLSPWCCLSASSVPAVSSVQGASPPPCPPGNLFFPHSPAQHDSLLHSFAPISAPTLHTHGPEWSPFSVATCFMHVTITTNGYCTSNRCWQVCLPIISMSKIVSLVVFGSLSLDAWHRIRISKVSVKEERKIRTKTQHCQRNQANLDDPFKDPLIATAHRPPHITKQRCWEDG